MGKYFLFLVFSFSTILIAQTPNIVPQLKKIEAAKLVEVNEELIELKNKCPGDPNVIFLEAVLTEDGEKAEKLYEAVYNNFPKSQYADAALFRSFSYFYALGLYKKAEELKNRIIKDYPRSPYLKNTERNFPHIDDMLIVSSEPYKEKPKTKRYTIQAGAFGNFQNAENLKRQFIKDGFYSSIIPKVVNTTELKIVIVGDFSNKTDAEKTLPTLENKYSIKGRIIPFE